MKKILFSMLAVAAIASCAKTEPTYVEADSEIKLNPVTTVATKANQLAAITTAEYPKTESFDVYAYWIDDDGQVMETPYLTGETSGVEFVNKGNYWGGKTTYYWPKNGSLRFAAYSPSSLDMTHTYANDTYELKDLAYPAADATAEDYTSKTYDILVAKTSEPYTAETGASKVSVKFEHALSWLTFKLQSTQVANGAFTVTKVVVNDVAKKGTLTANMAEGTKTWAPSEETSAIDVFEPADGYTVTSTAEVKENKENGLLVLPQAPTDVTVYYTQNALKDENGNVTSPELTNQKITVSLVLDNADDVWEPGKHYTYTILFDLDEILINPTVEDWEETTEVIINSDPVEVSSSAELVAAIAEGKNVELQETISLEQSLVINPIQTRSADKFEVVIDLNGNDIIVNNESTELGEGDAIIVMTGTRLTINGEGKVQGNTRAVWARGGNAEVVINGGHYVGAVKEGVEVIYASGDNSVITINGGKFEAVMGSDDFKNKPYDAVLNLQDKRQGTDIIVKGGSYKNFNPSDNVSENPQKDFVAPGYNVVETDAWYTVTAPTASTTLTGDSVVYGSFNVNDAVFDGAGFDVDVPATLTDNGLFRPAGNATVKNVKIDGNNQSWDDNGTSRGLRAIYITKAGNYVLDNVEVQNATYAINVNTTQTVNLTVKNSTLGAWTSYGGTTTADFTNVKFVTETEETYRPYGTTVLTDCSFTEGFVIDLGSQVEGATIVFDNCTYGGKPLAAADLTNAEGKAYSIR